MIEAIEIKRNHFVVRSFDPGSGKVYQTVTVHSEGEAIKFAYFCNRQYIVDRMTRWLHQRIAAFHVALLDQRKEAALILLAEIELCRSTSVSNLQKVIARNEKTIQFIAPGDKSRQYPYYQRVILDILNFCNEMEGIVA